jgi:hypothetical protein
VSALVFEDRNPESLRRSNVFNEGQMNRRRRQGILIEPSRDGTDEAPIVEIQMRPIAKEFDSLIAGSSYRFQEIHSDALVAMNLR